MFFPVNHKNIGTIYIIFEDCLGVLGTMAMSVVITTTANIESKHMLIIK